ncbi:GIY-YIG nuclease family protein [Candidatus Uhrbacteria bacterium]|nr:MAG: GIY-YIG nuclease family protein [Candidatus Uhrbacteria bacterium]
MYYVYILISLKDRRFYVGSTQELKRRFDEHSKGLVESTRHRRPLILLAYESYWLRSEAVRREMYLKSSDGKKDIRKRVYESLKELLGEEVNDTNHGRVV